PRMRVLDIQDAPRERPCDHHIEPATDGDAGSILGVLDRVIASLGIVRERAISIVPFLLQLLTQSKVYDLRSDFSSAKHELRKGGETVSGRGSPADPATVEERVGAVIGVWHVHELAAAHFRNHLESGTHSRGARSAPTDAGAAAKEALVVGKGGEFDGGFFGVCTIEFHAARHPVVLHKLERFFAVSVSVVFEKLLAELVVCAGETETCIADPRKAESHHVRKGATGVEEAACEDDDEAIARPILEAHDQIAVSGVFGKHGTESEGGGINKGDKSGRGM